MYFKGVDVFLYFEEDCKDGFIFCEFLELSFEEFCVLLVLVEFKSEGVEGYSY